MEQNNKPLMQHLDELDRAAGANSKTKNHIRKNRNEKDLLINIES